MVNLIEGCVVFELLNERKRVNSVLIRSFLPEPENRLAGCLGSRARLRDLNEGSGSISK